MMKAYLRTASALLLASFASASTEHLGEDAWQRRELLTEYSLGPAPYPHPVNAAYELFGDAFGQSDCIKVTDAAQHQKGALWSKKPIKDTSEWQADVIFRVGGQAGDFFGDGFAFYFSKQRGVGGNALGGPNRWDGIAVFFDTYKNKQFRGKRHPYVYGVVNDGSKNYELLKSRDFENGCHIPFRNKDPNILDQTMARITYFRRELSVVMKPVGSVDWVQCFKISEVDMPVESAFIGITAMTGELVDKHHMLEIKVYNRLDTDPYSYAVPNDVNQMPAMWDEMRHSGDIAREFTEWEQEIREETEFDPIEEDYEYKPYDDEEDYGEEYDEADKEEDDYAPQINTEKAKKVKERRARYEARQKAMENGRKSKEERTAAKLKKFSPAELESISEILANTNIGRSIVAAHEEQNQKIQKLRRYLESDITETVNKLTSMLREIRIKEFELNSRITQLSRRLSVEIDQTAKVHESTSRSWLTPFLLFFVVVLGVAAFGYAKYKSFMKTHLL